MKTSYVNPPAYHPYNIYSQLPDPSAPDLPPSYQEAVNPIYYQPTPDPKRCYITISNKFRFCEICHDRVEYPCGGYKCTRSVQHDLCSQVCGYCYDLVTTYSYNTSATHLLMGSLQQNCGRDDWSCEQQWFKTHPTNQSVTCW